MTTPRKSRSGTQWTNDQRREHGLELVKHEELADLTESLNRGWTAIAPRIRVREGRISTPDDVRELLGG